MSKPTDERSTPQWLFDALNKEFHFTLDVCASAENHKCESYYTIVTNGLSLPWAPKVCWMNPPYSELTSWLYKLEAEVKLGATVVGLLPVDTSTKWFHRYVWPETPHRQVRFLNKRLKFEHENSAKFANMVVVWTPENGLW